MAFLFKSKKNQERGVAGRDTASSGSRVNEKQLQRSTPTGSINSNDNEAANASPEQIARRAMLQQQQQQQQLPLSPSQPQPQSQFQLQSQPQLQAQLQPQSQQLYQNVPQSHAPGSIVQPQPPAPISQPQPPPSQYSGDLSRNVPYATVPSSSLYPWSQRRLTHTGSLGSPFPRYGAAVNSVASKEGDIYVMGGLINSTSVRGDLWIIEAGGNMSCYPVNTATEGPGPRVGHASLLVGNAFIVYGGDTKIDDEDILDETLYLLNTSTRKWSRALPTGTRPSGRYGHSLNILGSKIYIFGGQVEGYFMNDLSAFDLNQLQQPSNRWEILKGPDSPPDSVPPARTNHSMVTYQDKMYLFGGTNGLTWFNDVWCYDPITNTWVQLDCIGYIPVPREGHAAALVDDVMYIFGGRTETGDDLGDLAAFRIPSRRWYTFQNMGPSPSPRSGHSMTTVGKQIIVVGGEPSTQADAINDLAIAYCLDTTKIRYPNDPQTPTQRTRRPSNQPNDILATKRMPSRDGSNGPPVSRGAVAAGPATAGFSGPGGGAVNGHRPYNPADPSSQPGHATGNKVSRPSISSSQPVAAMNTPGTTDATHAVMSPTGPVVGASAAPASLGPPGPPPQQQLPKPTTAGPPSGVERLRNASLDGSGSPSGGRDAARETPEPGPTTNGRRTPTSNLVKSESRPGSANGTQKTSKPATGKHSKSQASIDNGADQPSGAKARPTSPPPSGVSRTASNPLARKAANRNSQTVAVLKELESARNRNAWYASELELARKAGYVLSSPNVDPKTSEALNDEDKPLLEALLAMKQELVNMQNTIDKQAAHAARQLAEAERQRDSALQQAVYAKGKLAGFGVSTMRGEGDDSSSHDIISDTNRKLAQALAVQKDLQDQIEHLNSELESEKRARMLADETSQAALKRMADLESYKQTNSSEVETLRSHLHQRERELREQSIVAADAAAALSLLQAEKHDLDVKHRDISAGEEEHLATLDGLRQAISASEEVKAALEQQLDEERANREKVESKLTKLKGEHEARTAELVAATQRLKDMEEMAKRHAKEAQMHRQALVDGLGKLTARNSSRGESKSEESKYKQQLEAATAQAAAANALVKKYQHEADSASDKLRRAEERIAGLEVYQEQASREGVAIRKQLQAALREAQSLHSSNADLERRLASQQLETNAVAVQHHTLKELLGERGISPTTTAARVRSMTSPRDSSPATGRSFSSLEQQLAAAQAAHEETKQVYAQQAQESEAAYREKLTQLENDYSSAIYYVRNTEKMLKQMKTQLGNYKSENTRLKAENDLLKERESSTTSTTGAAAGVGAGVGAGFGAAVSHSAKDQSWESERDKLQKQIETLQQELQQSRTQLESQLTVVNHNLQEALAQRDAATKDSAEAARKLSSSKKDLEALHEENSLLERRAHDAEQKVSLLLDQVESSVDNYRRLSRQAAGDGSAVINSHGVVSALTNGVARARVGNDTMPDRSVDPSVAASSSLLPSNTPATAATTTANATTSAAAAGASSVSAANPSHEGGSFSPSIDARNSAALDNLASELETLRSHWEATNNSYRTSVGFEFDAGAPGSLNKDNDPGLSASLAGWRKRLDTEERAREPHTAKAGPV